MVVFFLLGFDRTGIGNTVEVCGKDNEMSSGNHLHSGSGGGKGGKEPSSRPIKKM